LWVENRSDELWIGVKGQSNWEIAGSLRNIFRYGPRPVSAGGRALHGRGGFTPYRPKLRMPDRCTLGDRSRAIMCGCERVRTQTAG
jgi:hypothetical protein